MIRRTPAAVAVDPIPLTRTGWIESVLLLVVRLVLAGVFLYAAWMKLKDRGAVQSFAESIVGYDIIPLDRAEHLAVLASFVFPWAEALVGVALVLGAKSRAAGLLLSAMLALFTGAILSAIASGKEPSCGCFGDLSWPCGNPVGWCHVLRNGVLLLLALLIAWRGGGRLSADYAGARTAERRALRRVRGRAGGVDDELFPA